MASNSTFFESPKPQPSTSTVCCGATSPRGRARSVPAHRARRCSSTTRTQVRGATTIRRQARRNSWSTRRSPWRGCEQFTRSSRTGACLRRPPDRDDLASASRGQPGERNPGPQRDDHRACRIGLKHSVHGLLGKRTGRSEASFALRSWIPIDQAEKPRPNCYAEALTTNSSFRPKPSSCSVNGRRPTQTAWR